MTVTSISAKGYGSFIDHVLARTRQFLAAIAPDKTLITGVASGERTALGGLYDRHASDMLAVGLSILKDRQTAEDVIHDVWIEVWEKAHTYDPQRASVRTWLMVKMRSRCLDRLRRQDRRPTTRVDDLIHDDQPRHRADGESAAEREQVRAAIRQLSAKLSQVLMLSYFGGYSCSEIAQEISIPVGTVKSRLATARQRLVGLLESSGGRFE